MLLEEFDPDKKAIINPDMIHDHMNDFPETIVSIFSHVLFDRIVEFLGGEKIAEYSDVDGISNIYKVNYKNKSFGMVKGRLGGPACVGTFEDVIALGAKRIILLGNCGVLDKSIEDCGIIIPVKAIRDEGTSYHYAAPSDYIDVNKKFVDIFKKICDNCGYPYVEGITWTTDAFYRETPEKIAKRKAMGAVCVEMECASMQALCDFRNIDFFQFLYAGDNLDHSKWDPRSLSATIRLDDKEKIAMLAFELACKINE